MGKDIIESNLRLYLGGYDLSGDSRTFSEADAMRRELDMLTWADEVKPVLAGEMSVGLKGYQALLNDATGRAYQLLKDSPNAHALSLLFGTGGVPAAGDPAYLLGATQVDDKASFQSGVGIITTDFLPASGQGANLPWGRVLKPNTVISATENGTTVQDPAATAAGGHGILHILGTSSGNFAFKIEHSPDGAAWATLLNFTINGSAINSEHVAVTGAVDAYLRLVSTRTAGTATVVATFARN